MAKENTAKAATQEEFDDSRFTTIETERYMWNANKGCDQPLVGWLVNHIPMPEMNGRDWTCFVVKLSRPTKAIDREKKIVTVPAGAEVLAPATHQLAQHLTKAANFPDKVFEVKIIPKTKIDIGKGQTMWTYHLGANPQGRPRAEFGPVAMIGSPQLPTGQEVAESMGNDIPF